MQFPQFQREKLTPFFRKVRLKSFYEVIGYTQTIPCCQAHALHETFDFMQYGNVSRILYSRQDVSDFNTRGEMQILVVNVVSAALIELVEANARKMGIELDLQNVKMIGNTFVRIYLARCATSIRPMCGRFFLAIIRIRIALRRYLEKFYKPPNGKIYLKLINQFQNNLSQIYNTSCEL